MGKKLKDLWRSCRRVLISILLVFFGVGVPGGIAWIVWLLHDFVYTLNHGEIPLEERISFVSLWVAIVGFGLAVTGTVIAVLQFQASQRKPDLYLWIDEVGQEVLTLSSSSRRFRLELENRGNGVTRYLKCEVRFHLPRYETGSLLTRISLPPAKYRELWFLSRRSDCTLAGFDGKDDYVCYDNDRDSLGTFRVERKGLDDRRYKVTYELRCEGMERKRGVLWIEVPKVTQQTSAQV